jgi:hypothetical protein
MSGLLLLLMFMSPLYVPRDAMRLVFEDPLQSLMGGIQGQIPGTVVFTLGQLRLVVLVVNTLALVRMM